MGTPKVSVYILIAFLLGLLMGGVGVKALLERENNNSTEVTEKSNSADPSAKVVADTVTFAEEKPVKAAKVSSKVVPKPKVERQPQEPSFKNIDSTVVDSAAVVPIDSIMNDSIGIASAINLIDSMGLVAKEDFYVSDSIFASDTIITGEAPGEKPIVIKKEQYLGGRKLMITVLDTTTQKRAKDSLLTQLSGVVEAKNPDSILVEFWRSPLNYKGYKMANNKLVIYGLQRQFKILKVYQLNEKIYLQHLGVVYGVEHTFAYKAFDPVEDPNLLNRLRP